MQTETKRKLRIKLTGFLIISAVALSGLYFWSERKDESLKNEAETMKTISELSGPDWQSTILKFQKDMETRLRGPEGWLTVVGLTWLKPGDNSIGSDAKNAVILPASTPAQLGAIQFKNEKGSMTLSSIIGVKIDGVPATKIGQVVEMNDDGNGDTVKPTKIEVGSVTFWLIKRKNGVGVRMRDQNAEARTKFGGRHWFEPDPHYVIEGQWVAFDQPKPMMVPDILGNINEEKSPGFVRIEIDGQKYELHPTVDDDNTLFFVFRDATAGKETYGAARFLNTPQPQNGKLTLDFNRAVNPPCAFTHYATCPMPIAENVMKVAIRAGELKPPGH